MSKDISSRVRLLLVVATLLACLFALEVGLRVTGRYRLDRLDRLDGVFAQNGLSYGLRQNISRRVFWPNLTFVVNTDQYGTRARTAGPRDLRGKRYYAVIGASEVFGNGLDYEKTFVGVFAGKMAAKHIETVNLGVGGHHLLEQDYRLREFIASVHTRPEVVVITLNPLLIGGYDEVGSNVVVRHGELFDRENWRLPFARTMMARASAVYCFFRDSIRNVQFRYFERPDYSLDFYVERYSRNHPIRTAAKEADLFKHLDELRDYIRSIGATPVVVYAPTSAEYLLDDLKQQGKLDASLFDTDYFEDVSRRYSEHAGVTFVSFRTLLRQRYLKGEKLNFDLDAHYNAPTSELVGEFMYSALAPSASE
jgi:hypothetical protein